MLDWLAFAVLTAIVLAAVLRPLVRPTPTSGPRDAADVAVYRDQMAEIATDTARGLLTPVEAENARREVARRLLTAAGQSGDAKAVAPLVPKAKATAKKPVKRASRKVKAIPDGYGVVTAAFRVPGCANAIEFLEGAFGAKVRDRYDGPGGIVLHAELKLGDSVIMCGDTQPGNAETFPVRAMLYVKDADAIYARAVTFGATVVRPIQDQFYGDRSGTVRDSWGNEWLISTRKENVSRKEMKRRMDAMMKGG